MIKKLEIYVLCVVLCVLGVFCSIEIFRMYNIKSQEIGAPITIETILDYESVGAYDLGLIIWEENNNNYQYTQSASVVDFDGTRDNYTILFNEQLLNNIVVHNGQISGNLVINFYDIFGDVVATTNIKITITFSAIETSIKLETTNDNDNLSWFRTYNNINGAIAKVVSINNLGGNNE